MHHIRDVHMSKIHVQSTRHGKSIINSLSISVGVQSRSLNYLSFLDSYTNPCLLYNKWTSLLRFKGVRIVVILNFTVIYCYYIDQGQFLIGEIILNEKTYNDSEKSVNNAKLFQHFVLCLFQYKRIGYSFIHVLDVLITNLLFIL